MHEKKTIKRFTPILIILSLFWMSCADLKEDHSDDISYMTTLIENDVALNLDVLDNEGAVDEEYTTGIYMDGGLKLMADTLYPSDSYRLRFGRQIADRSRSMSFDVQEDTAYADLVRTISGNFYVVAYDSTDVIVDSFVKEFSEGFERRVRFVRTDSTSDRPWRIDAITLGNGGGGEKIRITNLTFYSINSDSAIFNYAAYDLSEYFIPRGELPTFTVGDTLRVELTIENDDPIFDPGLWDSGEKVLMHYGRGRDERARRRMSDAGIFADLTADDNVYTKYWRAHSFHTDHAARVFNMHYVGIDNNTLFVSEGGYNTVIWSLPYKLVRP